MRFCDRELERQLGLNGSGCSPSQCAELHMHLALFLFLYIFVFAFVFVFALVFVFVFVYVFVIVVAKRSEIYYYGPSLYADFNMHIALFSYLNW